MVVYTHCDHILCDSFGYKWCPDVRSFQ